MMQIHEHMYLHEFAKKEGVTKNREEKASEDTISKWRPWTCLWQIETPDNGLCDGSDR